GPGWSGPAPTTHPGPPTRRRWLPWVAAGAAAVVVAAVVLVVVLTRGGSTDDTTSPTTSAAPTTSAEEEALRGRLPAVLTGCDSAAPDGIGETARVECGADQPGPTSVRVSSYAAADDADTAFLGLVDRGDLPPLPARDTCPTSTGYYYWRDADQQTAGRVGCMTTTRGDAVLFWSSSARQLLVVATSTGAGADGLAALTDWWTANRDTFG
ncbi:hypothetical protein, partial [Klenkia sp. PcliD-1-E]|uniref:hypothetical protein n=1 Tax=Klenkia sp. PcliD-1-E TaxID=2954492 RepID=UPI002096F492